MVEDTLAPQWNHYEGDGCFVAQPLCPQAQAPLGADELRQASEQNSRPFSAGQEHPGCAQDFCPLAGSGIMTSFQTTEAVFHDGVAEPNEHP
jgi:hypothetical protein